MRDGRAVPVTGCPDVVELIGAFGGDPPVDQGTTAVLQALLRCDAAEESELAAALGCSEATVAVTLAGFEGAGFAVRGRRGWTVSDAALARIAGTDWPGTVHLEGAVCGDAVEPEVQRSR